MAHAQIQLYPETTNDDTNAPEGKWGWRKIIYVEPPEILEDTGTVFEDRAAAMDDALAKHPHWPIG